MTTATHPSSPADQDRPSTALLPEVRASGLLLAACFSLCGLAVGVHRLLAVFG